ncbi:MAG TPA: VOC family protein [Gammaproteobacteria bacterium]|nr:VOC family protein [Gammaproteobacteria bacterium]
MKLNSYLHFDGDCKQAFEFYAETLGGKLEGVHLWADMPGEDVPPERRDKIMHASLRVGEELLMGSDSPPEYYEEPKGFSVTLNIDDATEAERIFKALARDGKVSMPFAKTFFAEGFGMVTDRFGIPWMVNCEKPA